MGSRNLLISGIDVSRDLLCELAMELFDIVKCNPCTCVPFVFFRYPKSVWLQIIATLSRMLIESRRRQPTPSWEGMARTGTRTHVCFGMWYGFCRSARKLCSGDALRPDLSWVLNYTVLSVPFKGHLQLTGLRGAERGPQCALLGPLLLAGLHHRWSSATFVPVYPSFLQIPEECVAADHRCLVPNADKRAGGGNLPHPGMGWPALGPGPMYASGWVTSRPYRSQLVRARKLCSGDALRPDLPWVMNYTISVCPHRPLAVHRTGCCT